jgi:tripartite ATP-independent transporter DctP family solute receptor
VEPLLRIIKKEMSGMKRKLLGIGVLIFVTFLFACYTGVGEAADGDKITIRLGHIQNPGHDESSALERLVKELNEASGGRVVLEVYPSMQLGTEREMVEQVVMGTLDISMSDPGGWATGMQIPELYVFGLPFLYDSVDVQSRIINEIMMEDISKRMIPKGVRPLFCYSNGIRHIVNKVRPITKIEDLSGLKIRSPENPIFVQTWRCLGANSTTTPWGEVYTALRQNVVDAAEADPVSILNSNLHEPVKYYSRVAHLGGIHIMSINEDIWQSIPPDLQKIILDCVKANSEAQMRDRQQVEDEAEKRIADYGVIINDVSPEERGRMREAVQPMYDEYIEKYGLGDIIQRCLEIANEGK